MPSCPPSSVKGWSLVSKSVFSRMSASSSAHRNRMSSLRYAYFGEGQADLWAKGCWYGNSDAGFITEIDGTGCQGNLCAARVTKNGTKIWWLRIILPHTI